MEKIKVTARLRPSILNHDKVFSKEGNKIKIKNKDIDFNFDDIYDENKTNENIFDKSIKGCIDSSLKGFNYTLFAYGQTGSGKTFTMLGPKNDKIEENNNILDNYRGVLVYSLIHLFEKIKNDQNSSYFIKCSYLEIYNEYIYDLLDENSEGKPLSIHETKKKDFAVKGLKEEDISSVEEALFCLKKGERLRRYSESLLKHQSSRSHTILQIKIKKVKNDIVEKARRGTDDKMIIENNLNKKNNGSKVVESLINFIDLAGSERTFSSNKTDNYNTVDTEEQLKEKAKGLMKEGKYINKSLFFLTRVISLLSENKKNNKKPIPFRDSTLTKILKNSLGGNSKTTIILNLHNDKNFVEEGISTLRFGLNAKKIVNKVQANILTQNNNASLQILVRNYENKILVLKNSINNYHNNNIKLSCVVDKLWIEKVDLQKEVKEFNNFEDKSHKSFVNINNKEKYKNMLLKSQNIIEWQNQIINKLSEFSGIYLDKIKIITDEYQDEFIFSNEQKIKLLFFEKLEGFSMMTDNDLIKMENYINLFKHKLLEEQNRRIELNNNKNPEIIKKLKLIEENDKNKKNELLTYFQEKYHTFIHLKNSCNNELTNLEDIIKEHKEIIKVDEFLENIKEFNKENEAELKENQEVIKNMLEKFQSKFDTKKEKIKNENVSSNKKKLFKNQSVEWGNSQFKSNLNKKIDQVNDWKIINQEKKNLGLNNNNNNWLNLNDNLVIKEDDEEDEDISEVDKSRKNPKKKKITINWENENNKSEKKKNKNNENYNSTSNYLDKNFKNEKLDSNHCKTLPYFQKPVLKKTTTQKYKKKKKKEMKTNDLVKKYSSPILAASKYSNKNIKTNNIVFEFKENRKAKINYNLNKKPIKLLSQEFKFKK